ncbi:glycosyltransferase family 4 protein [Novosphingobium pentaromativorans]|uniref:Mannosyltransferase n=1 Tax=Novosphingobium pentaromativorans US6-1 TaxID=1088721 RepID=G6EA90_9SPHN|nr:glycosyltransferase family 1 protein [Novosphingobium pentaromativorans]AIT80771.1 mannosyltransferase [Novosphingobium pentaromativorans US6-1]EHJ61805.1 mannosyltransferase [Novosphingobium pentaromativorans US6-1]
MAGIAINGKFLGAPLNGVHRTAALYSRELIRRLAHSHSVRLLAPAGALAPSAFPELVPNPAKGPFGAGQGWEMLTLPLRARGDLLVNLCNLAPLVHGNSVVMIHDAQTFLYPDDYRGRQALAYRALLPRIARRARRILTVSRFARDSLVANGIGSEAKIEVVHNGTDHILAEAPDPSMLRRHGLTPGGYVLTIGSAKGYKNLRCLFDAMASPLPGRQKLVIAGGPDEVSYRRAGWKPPEGAVFTGFVSDGELRALYASAAVFVFPSLTEGFGLPPVEAMHCNTPVVAARAGAMPEVCGDAALLVEAGNPRAYRDAILALLDDPAMAERQRLLGRSCASRLSWDAAGARLAQLVQPLLQNGR